MTKRMIIGAGGGGKGGGSSGGATEAPDNLKSKAYAQVLDLVSEGEIEGLVDGLKSIYLDGTPIQNPDGSNNFTGVGFINMRGSQAQNYVPGFSGVENGIGVGLEVKAATPLVRQISNSNVNAVRVTVSVPQLTEQDTSNGNINGTRVTLAVDLQSNGGGYQEVVLDTIRGKTTSKYQRSYTIQLTGSAPWDIRVRRVTADSTNATLQNKTYFDFYTEIIYAKLRYPNSALMGVAVDSSQFSAIPTRGYDMKLLRVKIPSNYNPTTRAYTGSWDGTFQIAWTDNPAWCFYDLLTNERYGLGDLLDADQVDKWALYQIGKYCDELVPNGFGGTEPRFTCNMYLQSRAEAYKVIQDMASIFRGMAFWSTGSVTAVQDAPSDPVALYTAANVIGGRFTYSGTGLKARHTVALVTWNDPSDLYRQKVEYVEDAAAIARYGVQQAEVTAVGCTSRGQAHRVGRWLLYSERLETETVQFSVGLDGTLVRPGHVIKVADPSRAGARLGGRVSAATATQVTIDKEPGFTIAGWTLYAMMPDGTVEQRTITSQSGAALTVSPAFSAAPTAQAIWVASSTTAEAQTFRVLAVSEDSENKTYVITALAHDPDKYAAIENNLTLEARDITLLNDPPPAPTNGRLTESLYSTLTDVKTLAFFEWSQGDSVMPVVGWDVSYRVGSDNWVGIPRVTTPGFQLSDALPGDYSVSVRAVTAYGVKSQPLTFTATVLGKTAPPADITGLQMTVQGDTGVLQWDSHPDLDVRIGGQVEVRYADVLAGGTWASAVPVGAFPGNASSATVPLQTGTYLAKALDSTGNYSTNAALVVTNAAGLIQFNAVASSSQHPAFAGAKSGLVVAGGALQLDNATYVDSIASIDTWALTDGDLVASGEYTFDNYIDTGAVYTSRVSASFAINAFNVNPALATADWVDTWADVDAITNVDLATLVDSGLVELYISTTNDNPAGSPTWSAWRTFLVGDYTARAFRFKVALSRGSDIDSQVQITALSVTVDAPDRVESARNVAAGTSGLAVTFAKPYFSIPAVAVTAQNLATGDYAEITAKTATGFTIQFKNAAGTGVARTFDWIAKGY